MSLHKLPSNGFRGIIDHFRSDFLAAISVSLVALPLGLGVAAASGAPPIAGLISAIIGGIVATPFRGSHLAINGPAAGLIAVILSAIYTLDDGSGNTLNYVLAAICISGIIQVALGVLKLGRVAEIIPSSVIQGVMVAIGIIIFSTQINVALGLQPQGRNTIDLIKEVFANLGNINPIIAGISLLGIIMLVLIPKIQSRLFNYFPASLWVLVVGVVGAFVFNFFEKHTVDINGHLYDIGPHQLIAIPDNLMDAIMLPDFSRINEFGFWVVVISITLIASIQTLAMAKAVDKLDPYQRKTNLNKDLIGVGLATAVSGAIGGLPIITVIVRSTVNINNNAKTKWSNFYHGCLIILFLFIMAPLIQKVPLAALASILVYIGFRLAAPSVFKKIYDMGIEQLTFMMVTIVITLNSGLLWGILGGMLFTLLVHILLSRMPIGDFFSDMFSSNTKLAYSSEGAYTLSVTGIASFLKIPMIIKMTVKIHEGSEVHIDLSKTRLVGLTFMEYLEDFSKKHVRAGGKVFINGLESHVSSSKHSRALKISLNTFETQLSQRQLRLQHLSNEHGYQYTTQSDWNDTYLKKFRFFEIKPIEHKSDCLQGVLPEINMDWEVSDVTFNEGAGFTAEVFSATVMVLKLNQKIPVFSLEKEGMIEKFFDRVMAFTGYKDIDFNMYPEFSKKFLLMGENTQEIRSFFSEDIIRFFESNHIFHVESNGEALLIFDKIKLARTDETMQYINYSNHLATLIYNRVVSVEIVSI